MNEINSSKIKVAAIQMEAIIGDVEANLRMCEDLADEAASKGAEWIILPEFFTTGMAFDESLIDAVLSPNGKATTLLKTLAKRHHAYVGGSFLCRQSDGHVRNTFYLVSPEGLIVGEHDKDLPTMWENSFYLGGEDDGIIQADNIKVGSVLCWEFMRSQTANRLVNQVDMIVGGSCWWSIPNWHPKFITNKWEAKNEVTALNSVQTFASYVGVPIVHAAHCGSVECEMPWMPIKYRGFYEGGAMIVDAKGDILAIRNHHEGPGVVIAEVIPEKQLSTNNLPIPNSFWLHKRGTLPSLAWTYQRWHGQRWYHNHMPKKTVDVT